MRFLFVYPHHTKAAGGMKQARLMVSRLVALRVDAQLLMERPDCDDTSIYEIPVPVAPVEFGNAANFVSQNDVVIVPEHRLEKWLSVIRNWPCRRAVNNQNGYFALDYRQWAIERRFGVEFVIANSPTVAQISSRFLGIAAQRVFYVPHLVTIAPFTLPETPQITGQLAVAYMPRKCPEQTVAIREGVRRLCPNVPWVEIDGVSTSVVAERLIECRIFLSTQMREGCPLPSLEAMTRGCLIAGYAGTPGYPHPYANSSNGLWSRDGDVNDAIAKVTQAIHIAAENGPTAARYAMAAHDTASLFSMDAVDTALKDMLQTVIPQTYQHRQIDWGNLPTKSKLTAYRHLRRVGRLFLREQIMSSFHTSRSL